MDCVSQPDLEGKEGEEKEKEERTMWVDGIMKAYNEGSFL